MITAIAFDVMDTLLRDPYRDALEAATGRALDDLLGVRDPALYPAFERGDLDEEAYWAGYHRVGISVDPVEFHRVRRAGLRWLPGMRELVLDLAGHVELVTGSNYPVWIEEVADAHLDGLFEQVIASCHLGVRKPEPRFFLELLARIGRRADEVLFVDDRAVNVEAAREVGVRAHLFTDAATVRRWIRRHGVGIPPAR